MAVDFTPWPERPELTKRPAGTQPKHRKSGQTRHPRTGLVLRVRRGVAPVSSPGGVPPVVLNWYYRHAIAAASRCQQQCKLYAIAVSLICKAALAGPTSVCGGGHILISRVGPCSRTPPGPAIQSRLHQQAGQKTAPDQRQYINFSCNAGANHRRHSRRALHIAKFATVKS
jgi:hypothetical protein